MQSSGSLRPIEIAPLVPSGAPTRINIRTSQTNDLQGQSRSAVPGDFETVLPSGGDTVLLLGGAVCGSELRSTLRTGGGYRNKQHSSTILAHL